MKDFYVVEENEDLHDSKGICSVKCVLEELIKRNDTHYSESRLI